MKINEFLIQLITNGSASSSDDSLQLNFFLTTVFTRFSINRKICIQSRMMNLYKLYFAKS